MWTRWNDFGFGDFERTLEEFDALRREMNRLFSDEFPLGRALRSAAESWPRVALHDRGTELSVRAELPGVREKDLEVHVDRGVLTLKGKRTVEVPEGYSVHRQERGDVTFARALTLPCQVDAEKAVAKLKHGVLTLELPKAAEHQPRQIAVSTN